jgi:hypothetical protein
MSRHHTTLSSLVRRLRPSPQRFAAAAALQDPNLLLQYRAAPVHEELPQVRRRSGARFHQGCAGGRDRRRGAARRDLGELREGRRLTVPVLAALAGMAASAGVYLAVTAGAGAGAGGWGAAISTDAALAPRAHRAVAMTPCPAQ